MIQSGKAGKREGQGAARSATGGVSHALPLSRSHASGRGFTFIEVVVVVAVIGFLSAIAMPFLSTAIATNDLQIAAEEAVDALREAQSSSMSGRNAGRFGVHFETSQFVFFEGAAYSAGAQANVAHPLTGNVTASAITISGGGSDVHFASHEGEPTETGTIVFSDQSGDTSTVSINAAGMVEVQ